MNLFVSRYWYKKTTEDAFDHSALLHLVFGQLEKVMRLARFF